MLKGSINSESIITNLHQTGYQESLGNVLLFAASASAEKILTLLLFGTIN